MSWRSFRSIFPALLAIAATVLAMPGEHSGQFILVDKGKPAAAIVIPQKGEPADRRAAEILQSSIRKISGSVIPILEKGRPGRGKEIAIGFATKLMPRELLPAAGGLREDGFLIASSGRNLYILSGGHKGSIYGVVHLLERYFGCRKFSPAVEVFPKRDTLTVGPLFESDNPVNEFRVVHGEFARDPDYQDWQRLDLTDEVFGRGYYVHTFNRLVPWETYFASHPEYFAWMNGKRIIDQLCLSRPEVLEITVAKLKSEMAAQPDKEIWSVSQNDNFSYCQCEACNKIIEEEGSPAGPVIRFVNAVAAHFPDKIISTLAYQYSRPAPKLTKPAPKYGRGNIAMLTDGVRGANDFKVHWLGWEAIDFDIMLDVGSAVAPREVSLSTLYDPHSWILHPRRVTCYVSADGSRFQEVQTLTVEGDQRKEDVIRTFGFTWAIPNIRFVKFHVEGTKKLPDWHPSAGGGSWVFIDEIIAR